MTFSCSISDLLKSFSSLVLTAFAAVNAERCSSSSCSLRLGRSPLVRFGFALLPAVGYALMPAVGHALSSFSR